MNAIADPPIGRHDSQCTIHDAICQPQAIAVCWPDIEPSNLEQAHHDRAFTSKHPKCGLGRRLGADRLRLVRTNPGCGQKAGDSATLVSVEKDGATFNVDGKRRSIKLGEAPLSAPTSSSPTASLTSDSRGHFMADGQVNGQAIRFIVDTGATMVSLSSADARRLGINYLAGQPTQLSTANGVAQAWRVRLDSVRVANITINNVDAVVMDNAAMPALLGMSFLNRTDMKREGNIMTLVKKF